MDQQQQQLSQAALPSPTGLYVFAKREGLWDAKAPEFGPEQVRNLILAYHQKQLGQSLEEAHRLVDAVPEVVLQHFSSAFERFKEPTMPTATTAATAPVLKMWEALQVPTVAKAGDLKTDGRTVWFHGAPIFRLYKGMISASWGGRATLSTASTLNGLCELAMQGRPFKVGLDQQPTFKGEPCSLTEWVQVGPAPVKAPLSATASTSSDFRSQELGLPAARTAASYPQAVGEKGGDPDKVKKALEKAVGALNEAVTAALKFDDRINKLERDTYAIFREYLGFAQQEEALQAQEEAKGVTSSLSTPPTDERSGEFDSGDVETGDSVTAAADEPKTLAEARAAYVNGHMTAEQFDAFVEAKK